MGRDKFKSQIEDSSSNSGSFIKEEETRSRSSGNWGSFITFRAPTLTVPPGELVKSGFLTKKGAKRKNWNLRWFILKDKYLIYFKDEKDFSSNKEPYGIVQLEECFVAPFPTKMFGFTIAYNNSEKRDYFICAESNESVTSWMDAIRQCIHKPIPIPEQYSNQK